MSVPRGFFRPFALTLGLLLSGTMVSPAARKVETLKDLQEREKKVIAVSAKALEVTVGILNPANSSSGSGVIVSKDGLVMTAAHVIGKPGEECLVIMPDGTRVKAKNLGSNKSTDAGMVQITEEGEWPYLKVGSPDSVNDGDWVVATGHPSGFQRERSAPVRFGRIVGTSRSGIQSDCTLVGGDSGGPLFNLDAEVIGIHSSIGGTIVENRHVHVAAFNRDWERMKNGESWGRLGSRDVDKPVLGVMLDRTAREGGVTVRSVSENSPAMKGGMKSGDVIKSFDGKEVTGYFSFAGMIGKKNPGDKVKVGVLREGKTVDLEITLGRIGDFAPQGGRTPDKEPEKKGDDQKDDKDKAEDQPPSGDEKKPAGPEKKPAPAGGRPFLGVRLLDDDKGALVDSVVDQGPANKAGVKSGDVIVSVDGKEVSDASGLVNLLGSRKPGEEVTIQILRDGKKMDLKTKLGSFPMP